uniref:Ankyrin repeat domain 24 n=1 Tax=Pelusios castaneus TaxID=367368 RepID=A0A8C8S0W8_9SAUR
MGSGSNSHVVKGLNTKEGAELFRRARGVTDLEDTSWKLRKCGNPDWGKNDEKLLQAVDYNDPEKVTSLLLRKGLVPTKLDSEGTGPESLSPLALGMTGVTVLSLSLSGYNALHLAAKHGHPHCVSKLLQVTQPNTSDGGLELDKEGCDGSTPLILAAKMSHSELCRYLLRRGAAVNSRDQQGRTALMLACENGSVETVEVLIHAGARVNMVDARGQDAARYSLATGNALIQHYLQATSQRNSCTSGKAPGPNYPSRGLSTSSSPREGPLGGLDMMGPGGAGSAALSGAELLLSKKTLSLSTEELLTALQGQVQSLTMQNKELLEKIQVPAHPPSAKQALGVSPASIPRRPSLVPPPKPSISLMCRLRGGTQWAWGLESALLKRSTPEAHEGEGQEPGRAGGQANGSSRDGGDGDVTVDLAKMLSETQEKYKSAVAEVQLLQEQMRLGILSVEEKESAESSRRELETVRAALQETQEALLERKRRVKDLEGHLDAQEEAARRGQEAEELRASLGASLEEAAEEKAALQERCSQAEAEVEQLRKSLAERGGELERATGLLSESRRLEEESQELHKQLTELTEHHENVQAQLRQLHKDQGRKEEELGALKERLAAEYISRQEHEEIVGKLGRSLAESDKRLSELKEQHGAARQEVTALQQAAECYKQESVPLSEHTQAKEALEGSIRELIARAQQLEQELAAKAQEASQLQGELESMQKDTVPRAEHEELRCSLQAKVNALSLKLSDLTRKHEKTCTEVFQVQREALFMKSEKHAAEAQLATVEKQMQSLRAESERIQELHGHIEDSAKLVKEKDRKVSRGFPQHPAQSRAR